MARIICERFIHLVIHEASVTVSIPFQKEESHPIHTLQPLLVVLNIIELLTRASNSISFYPNKEVNPEKAYKQYQFSPELPFSSLQHKSRVSISIG